MELEPVQALSAQRMFHVVKRPATESGNLAREYGMLTLCTEYLTQTGLTSHFWLSGT